MTLLPARPLPILTVPVRSQDEQRLLALTMRSVDVADVVLDPAILRATDFYHEYHSRIHTAMHNLHMTGQPVSIASVTLELRRRSWEDEAAYIFDTLLDCVHFSYSSEDIAAWIKALQQRRKAGELQTLQREAIAAVESGNADKMKAACAALVEGISDTPTTPAGYTLYSYSSLAMLPPARWLVEGEIPANGLSMLVGPSRGGKSFVMTDRAIHVALTHPDEAVIYIAPEGSSGYRKRMDAWCQHHGVTPPENLYFILDTVPLLDAAKRELFLASLGTLKPVLIVVDTLAQSLIGGDENSAKDIGLLIDACDQLRRATGAAVQLVHHTGKKGAGYRGSSALLAGLM